ncbi:helix-turn-helix domain-containing protein [Tropicimonas sp. IMCC34043]|uniref:helix-turn-helix domain-containing protein n=1 Tax=Tropicimonas sp. IMCC34043 TaxID=2248760 RepID=UPI00130087A7|nr:helix-turn-helix domain-containing protein [Tropicimonas sp. IMCC34043]
MMVTIDASPAAQDRAAFGNELRAKAIGDAATQATMQPWVAMKCYQLSRGGRVSQMHTLDLGSQQIVQEHQFAAVQKLGSTPANFCTISYSTPSMAFRFSDHATSCSESIFFMPERTDFDIYVPAGTQTAYIGFSQREFLEAARALNPAAWDLPSRQVSQFQCAQLGELKAAVAHWLCAAETAASAGDILAPEVLRAIILETVLRVLTASASDKTILSPLSARSRAVKICRMAREYVDERLAAHEMPTIVDICVSLSVSERALLYAFHSYVDMSPQAYLRLCRLNHVRTTLLAGNPTTTTVTHAAMQMGFLHLSRFAGDYRQVFEETPKVTLARRS